MNPRKILLILVALIGVMLVFMLTRNFLNNAADQASQAPVKVVKEETVQILVARRDLPTGTIVKATDFEFRKWPKGSLRPEYYGELHKEEIEELPGKVVRTRTAGGQPLVRSTLVSPGTRGFLAAALRPGMRAVTVQINTSSGVGGFVFPGDRVDLIMTHTVVARGQETTVAETVLRNVRVLGLDQRSDSNANVPTASKTATLEVTPKFAEKLALLPRVGKLTLALRSLAAENEEEAVASLPSDTQKTHTYGAELSDLKANPGQPSKVTSVRLTKGASTRVIRFSQDGSKKVEHEDPIDAAKDVVKDVLKTVVRETKATEGPAPDSDKGANP